MAVESCHPATLGVTVVEGRHLDDTSFQNFAPLLAASDKYVQHSGFRFRSNSFSDLHSNECLNDNTEASSNSLKDPYSNECLSTDTASSSRLEAKILAAPLVQEYADRLMSGEPALMEELETAFRFVMVESVRNSMISTCRELDLFPPAEPPADLDDDDCSYEDVSAPLPVIAQRLYNDQVRRCADGKSSMSRLQQRALTAAYLVDFASEHSVPLPPMSETHQAMLSEFAARTAEWGTSHGIEAEQRAKQAFLNSLDNSSSSAAVDLTKLQAWWAQNWHMAAWALAGVIVVGWAHIATSLVSALTKPPPSRVARDRAQEIEK